MERTSRRLDVDEGAIARGARTTLFVGSAEAPLCQCVPGYFGQACEDVFAVCGDGLLNPEAGEECDDGNNLGFDGCDETCRIEQNWLCVRTPRTDVLEVEGVAPSLVSKCSCPGVFSPVLGCLATGL